MSKWSRRIVGATVGGAIGIGAGLGVNAMGGESQQTPKCAATVGMGYIACAEATHKPETPDTNDNALVLIIGIVGVAGGIAVINGINRNAETFEELTQFMHGRVPEIHRNEQ